MNVIQSKANLRAHAVDLPDEAAVAFRNGRQPLTRLIRALIIAVLFLSLAANLFMYLRWRRTRPILNINGQTITEKDVFDYLMMAQGTAVKAELVKRAILDQEAQKQGVAPTQQEIDHEFNQQKELNWQVAMQIQANPWSEPFVKDQIRETLEQQRLLAKGVPVSEDEMRDEYNSRPQAYDIPNKAHCQLAAVLDTATSDDIAQIKQLMEKGVSPADIQSNYSGSIIFPGDNYIFTFVQPFGTNYNTTIFEMKPGQVKQLLAPGSGLQGALQHVRTFIVRLVDIVPGHKYNPSDSKDAEITERIRLAVAAKRMKPLSEWLQEEWPNVHLTTEDPTDTRWIEQQLVPDLNKSNKR